MSGRVGRIVLWLVAVGLVVLAWRSQLAFQFGAPRLLWGWCMLGAVVALFACWWAVQRGGAAAQPALAPRRELALVLLALAVGIGFRLVRAGSVPPGMNHDAAFNGMYALHVLQGAPYTPYVSAAWGRETLFMYLCTPLVAWLGNRPEAIQWAATLVGITTLPVFYAFARPIVGPRVALLGLALFAVCGWHVLFSRVGWRMILVPPFAMGALSGLWYGLAGRRWGWGLAGAAAAGAIYTYDAGRMVPIMVAVLLALATLAAPERWRRHLLGGLAALLTFLLVGAPMLFYAAAHPQQFLGRAANLAGSNRGGLLGAAPDALLMFNYRGNGNDFFVDEPLLQPLLAVLFVLGLLVTLTRWRGGAERFLLGGFVLALLPGILAVPNGNRCIIALPFAILFAAIGLAALCDLGVTLLPAPAARRAAAGLALLAVAIGGAETYGEFLGAAPRRIIGFGPEATAAGQYLRGFGERYNRYVVAEDWPEYTLAYLSYNGGGSPLANHYVLGRRLEDIEPQINRYGRKGLVFVTDLKPAGRAAYERLSRQFGEHRSEEIRNPRDGRPVAMALIIEPQHAARSGLFSDASRVLAVGGDDAATAMRCFPAVGQALGYTVRLQVMRLQGAGAGGEIALLNECPPRLGRAPLALTLGFGAGGLEVRGRTTATVVPAAGLEPGRWYELVLALGGDGKATVYVDGGAPTVVPLATPASRLTGFVVSTAPGIRLFVDDVAAAPGLLEPREAQWSPVRRASALNIFEDDFERTPFGAVRADAQWRGISGLVSAIAGPSAAGAAAPAPADAGNAFDGGHGTGPGELDQPIGIAVGPHGRLFVADRNNHRVQAFARDGSFVRAWGRQGNAAGEFKEPHDVAADDEFVYVADLWNQRVQAFDGDGQPMFAITGAPSLSSPRGLAVHDRRIYIAEAAAGRVTVYDRDGHLLATIGESGGTGVGHLVEPVDVAIAPNGDVWVVNSGNNRLEHFAAGGRPLGNLPIPGWTGTRLKEIYLTIDGDGVLYLGDWDAKAVRRFRSDGTELAPLGSAIKEPSGLALDGDRLLVVSRGDDVVRVVPLH